MWWLMNNEWKIILKEVGKPGAQHIHKPAHWANKVLDAGKPEQLSRYSDGSIAGRGKRFVSIPQFPDRFWGSSSSLLSSEYMG